MWQHIQPLHKVLKLPELFSSYFYSHCLWLNGIFEACKLSVIAFSSSFSSLRTGKCKITLYNVHLVGQERWPRFSIPTKATVFLFLQTTSSATIAFIKMKVVILQRGDDKGWRRRMDHTALRVNTCVRQAVTWSQINLLYCPLWETWQKYESVPWQFRLVDTLFHSVLLKLKQR